MRQRRGWQVRRGLEAGLLVEARAGAGDGTGGGARAEGVADGPAGHAVHGPRDGQLAQAHGAHGCHVAERDRRSGAEHRGSVDGPGDGDHHVARWAVDGPRPRSCNPAENRISYEVVDGRRDSARLGATRFGPDCKAACSQPADKLAEPPYGLKFSEPENQPYLKPLMQTTLLFIWEIKLKIYVT